MPVQKPTGSFLPWTVKSPWNPNAPGNTPGPYDGYYDANGFLHCSADDVPYIKETGYPKVGYYNEYGYYQMTQEEVDSAPPSPYPKVLPESQRTPYIREWNPDAPGNTPGEYGGYYDVNGDFHCKEENMPKGIIEWRPKVSYIDEKGNIYYKSFWEPNGFGATPGPYGGYYDASGQFHCKDDDMPRDGNDFPLVCYNDEYGSHCLTYPEKQKSMARERYIDWGGHVDLSDLDGSEFGFLY